jgi:hypothetical protein
MKHAETALFQKFTARPISLGSPFPAVPVLPFVILLKIHNPILSAVRNQERVRRVFNIGLFFAFSVFSSCLILHSDWKQIATFQV